MVVRTVIVHLNEIINDVKTCCYLKKQIQQLKFAGMLVEFASVSSILIKFNYNSKILLYFTNANLLIPFIYFS